MKRSHTYVIFLVLLSLILFGAYIAAKRPSNDRDWSVDQALLSQVERHGDRVSIRNIRNFEYTSEDEYTPGYYDRTISLNQVETVWYMVEPFDQAGAAHTLVSFGLNDGSYIAISVEIRKEKGEKFSAFRGLFREYELMYVIADERDVIKLRANFRKDPVYLYPVITTPDKAQALFIDMLTRAQTLSEKPEFYNTLTNTCTTAIVRHVNKIAEKKVPLSFKVLFPAYSDRLAYDLGLLDTSISFEALREQHLINRQAERYADDPEFSKRIREHSL